MILPPVRNYHAKLALLSGIFVVLLLGSLPLSVLAASLTGGNHLPITITKDGDFTTSGSASGCGCVTSGIGSPDNPFIIGPWTIMATSSGPGISIDGTSITKYFILSHITLHGTTANDGLVLTNINGLGTSGQHLDGITAANIDGAKNGILLSNTAGVTITGNSVNNNFEWGIRVSNSHDDTVTFMTVAHNGLSNPNSRSPGANLVFLEQKFAGGVLFQDSNHNELSRSQLSEDAYTGFMLVRSNNNTVFDVHARYPDYFGGVLQDSSYNTLNRIDMQTADFSGLIIRGGGFNTVMNSDFSANGPIGNEIKIGIVPYFISGLYLGWGTHDNRIIFNHSNNGNTGPGLVVDNGTVKNPVTSPTQNMNPLNNAAGNDPRSVPITSGFDPGKATAAGSGNTFCGNSFASSNLATDPNTSC